MSEGETPWGFDPEDFLDGATWGGTGVYGPALPESCDVAVLGQQATRAIQFPDHGYPPPDPQAAVEAEAQTLSCYLYAEQRAAQGPEPEPEAGA
jgi:hypothetical protein